MSVLVYRSGDGRPRTRSLPRKAKVILGRDPASDVVFDHPSISRRHAVIQFEDGNFHIQDQNSKNGIYVNGERTGCHRLQEGDVIVLGLDTAHPIEYSLEEQDPRLYLATNDWSGALTNGLKNLQRLMQVNEAITTSRAREEVLDLVLESALEISSGRSAVILLKNKSGALEAACRKVSVGCRARRFNNTLIQSIIQSVIETRKPLLSSEPYSFAVVPLLYSQGYLSRTKIGDPVMGVIYVEGRSPKRRFTQEDLHLFVALSYQAAISIENEQLQSDLQEHYVALVASLARAVELKDRYTMGHSELVSDYAASIAEDLDLGDKEIEDIVWAGLLHDVGKMAIDAAILNKPGTLNEEEFEIIKQHPRYSTKILEPIPHLENVREMVLHHHERLDGLGYPDGLQENEINLGTRIIAVADVFEALTADRAYRKAFSPEGVILELEREAVSRLDSELVAACLKLYKRAEGRKDLIKPRSSRAQSAQIKFRRTKN